MAKIKNTTSEDVRSSVASIYSDLLSRRRQEKEERDERKRLEEEAKQQEKELKKSEEKDAVKMSKEERRKAELDNWKEIIVDLTGEDLEYSSPRKNKKKYRKWIDDDVDTAIKTVKPKKNKKKNYSKEFAPELQMLKTIVADQNKFTADLQKRFNTMAGPATKDAMPPNKTMVELASVINAGRSNSLGVLKEIGNLKKVIAELYIKQRKEEGANGGSVGPMDLGLLGSSLASNLFADDMGMQMSTPVQQAPSYSVPGVLENTNNIITAESIGAVASSNSNQYSPTSVNHTMVPQYQEFDPSTWGGIENVKVNASVEFETIPHTVVVEMNNATKDLRFKAIRNDTGEELHGCPVPTYDTRNLVINEKDMVAKGQFDETYKIEVV